MDIYEIIKQTDFELFCQEYENRGFSWIVKETEQMVNRVSYLKTNSTGRYIVSKPNFAVPVMFLIAKDQKYLETYFRDVIKLAEKEKKKKIKRLSGEQIDEVERKYFKALIKNDVIVSLRYGMELFERDYMRFVRVSITFALMTGWEKTIYVTAMDRLMNNNFDSDTKRDIAIVTIKFMAVYVNRLDNYEKEYMKHNEGTNVAVTQENIDEKIGSIKKIDDKNDSDYLTLIYFDGIKLLTNVGGKEIDIFFSIGERIRGTKCDDIVKAYALAIEC